MSQDSNTIIFTCGKEDLLNDIRRIIKQELQATSQPAPETVQYTINGLTEKPFYTAKETCIMFGISRQTLHMWMKKEIIIGHKVNSRLYILREDIMKLWELKKAS